MGSGAALIHVELGQSFQRKPLSGQVISQFSVIFFCVQMQDKMHAGILLNDPAGALQPAGADQVYDLVPSFCVKTPHAVDMFFKIPLVYKAGKGVLFEI